MKLQEAIGRRTAQLNTCTWQKGQGADQQAGEVLKVVELWLRHNNFDAAADALESEHMP